MLLSSILWSVCWKNSQIKKRKEFMRKTDCRSTVILQVPFPYRALYGLSTRWTNLCVGEKRFHLAHPVSTAITDTASLPCILQIQMYKTIQNNKRGRCDKCFATCSYSLPKRIPSELRWSHPQLRDDRITFAQSRCQTLT